MLRANCPDCKADKRMKNNSLTLYHTGDGEWVCEKCRNVWPECFIPRIKVVETNN